LARCRAAHTLAAGTAFLHILQLSAALEGAEVALATFGAGRPHAQSTTFFALALLRTTLVATGAALAALAASVTCALLRAGRALAAEGALRSLALEATAADLLKITLASVGTSAALAFCRALVANALETTLPAHALGRAVP